METQTMTCSELIATLDAVKAKKGDFKIYLSSDSEGNGYGTLKNKYSFCVEDEKLLIFPFDESLDYEELTA